MSRYSAKLLFQFRVQINQDSNKMRTCEERIIVFKSTSPLAALKKAKIRGKKAEFNYKNDDGNKVFFEFVGIQDLLELGLETQEDEVWYGIKDYLLPMERKDKILPHESELSVFKRSKHFLLWFTMFLFYGVW